VSGPQPATPRPPALKAVAFASGIAAAIVVGIALRDRLPANPPQPTPAPEPVERAAAPPPVRSSSPEQPLAPFGTLELTHAEFPASGPVRITLGLLTPSADDQPRPVRVVSQSDHRILELAGALNPDRTAATIEIDRTWLLPGSYLVELQSTERTPPAQRRYAIVVR
jgi:hypothetical protein